jgi:hypothetical protein
MAWSPVPAISADKDSTELATTPAAPGKHTLFARMLQVVRMGPNLSQTGPALLPIIRSYVAGGYLAEMSATRGTDSPDPVQCGFTAGSRLRFSEPWLAVQTGPSI